MATIIEGNNELNVQIVPLVADIRLSNLRFEPISPKAGDIVYTYVTARNYGPIAGSRRVTFRVTPPEGKSGSVTYTVTLAPGESREVRSLFRTTLEGTHYVSVDGLTGSFTTIGAYFQVGIGIYDETGSPVAGIIWVDNTSWKTAQKTVSLQLGDHAFGMFAPSGYSFLRWEIYDADTGALITQKSTKFFWLMVDKALSLRAIVMPS